MFAGPALVSLTNATGCWPTTASPWWLNAPAAVIWSPSVCDHAECIRQRTNRPGHRHRSRAELSQATCRLGHVVPTLARPHAHRVAMPTKPLASRLRESPVARPHEPGRDSGDRRKRQDKVRIAAKERLAKTGGVA